MMNLDLTRIKPRHIIFEAKHMDGVFKKGPRYAALLEHFLKHGYKVVSEEIEDTHIALAAVRARKRTTSDARLRSGTGKRAKQI